MHISDFVEQYQLDHENDPTLSFIEYYKNAQDSKTEISFKDSQQHWDYFATRDFGKLPSRDINDIFDIMLQNCKSDHKMFKVMFECNLHALSDNLINIICKKYGDIWYKDNYMHLIEFHKWSNSHSIQLEDQITNLKNHIKMLENL